MIEDPPRKSKDDKHFSYYNDEDIRNAIASVNEKYLYWDKAKYCTPDKIDPKTFWMLLDEFRQISYKKIFIGGVGFNYFLTDNMHRMLHKFDNLIDLNVSQADKKYYALNSVMEEAISSSQIEGASTTRLIAKDILQKNKKPKDVSQEMIVNNYKTMNYVIACKDSPLTCDFVLQIHKIITQNTLSDKTAEGAFRNSDNIIVGDAVTGEVIHKPIDSEKIPKIIEDICIFANSDDTEHPVIKAVILHFLFSYFHMFVDGNGRTARAIFYWYMLKSGYDFIKFTPLSRIISKTKRQYEKAFIYCEKTDLDLGYFIQYHLCAMSRAYDEFIEYIQAKSAAKSAILDIDIPSINSREAEIIKILKEHPDTVYTSSDLQPYLHVTAKTIRKCLKHLASLDVLSEVMLTKRLHGYAYRFAKP